MNLTDAPAIPLVDGYWVRSGSCDQCALGSIRGECCTKLVFPLNPKAAGNPDLVHFWELHGVKVQWWGDLPLVIVPTRCSALAENGDCKLYGSPDRPDICSEGPLNPWAGKPLNSACSYDFEWATNRKEGTNGL